MRKRTLVRLLLEKGDLILLIRHYLGETALERCSQNTDKWVGRCPFHNEKSPSFVVSASKQVFHCFGCGASGNPIEFVRIHLDISFSKAIEEMQAVLGIRLSKRHKRPISSRRHRQRRVSALSARERKERLAARRARKKEIRELQARKAAWRAEIEAWERECAAQAAMPPPDSDIPF